MSNLVSIKYNKTNLYPEISINGEAISRYMTLTNYIYNDVFQWADLFYEVMDGELAEPYEVELVGHPYHRIIFEAAKESSEYCTNVLFTELTRSVSIPDKYAFVLDLSRSYNVLDGDMPDCIDINYDQFSSFSPDGLTDVVFNERESDFAIYAEDESRNTAKYVIKISDSEKVIKRAAGALINIRREDLQILIDYLNIYHLRLKTINEFITASPRVDFPEEVRTELDAYINEKVNVIIYDIPYEMDLGERFEVPYKVFPKTVSDSYVTIESLNPGVIGCSGKKLTALQAGEATVRVLGANGEVLRVANIRVIKHNYITSLVVLIPKTKMRVGETMNIKIVATPENAEDSDQLNVTVNNEKVAVITGRSDLYAVSSGRVCVTVSTPRISRRVFINVAPDAAGLILPMQNIDLPLNATASFGCAYYPANAVPIPRITWESSDQRVVTVQKSGDFDCILTSNNTGTATVTCKIVGTKINKTVKVTVG